MKNQIKQKRWEYIWQLKGEQCGQVTSSKDRHTKRCNSTGNRVQGINIYLNKVILAEYKANKEGMVSVGFKSQEYYFVLLRNSCNRQQSAKPGVKSHCSSYTHFNFITDI